MTDDLVPTNLPSFRDWLSNWFGFQLPTIPLPQTAKNLDKAFGRILDAGGSNIASRIEGDTIHRQARGAAEVKIIGAAGRRVEQEINSSDSVAERAIEFSFGKAFIEQENREKIARLALEDMRDKVADGAPDAPSEIDDDWLNSFSDFASQKSNEQIQALWAKILSGKIRHPSSFSLKSLQLLSSIDTTDAILIHEILSYAIGPSSGAINAIIFKSPIWNDISKFIACEDLGVLSGTAGTLTRSVDLTSYLTPIEPQLQKIMLPPFMMAGTTIYAWVPKINLQIPCFNLTRFGSEMLALTDGLKVDEQYEQSFIAFLKGVGAILKRAVPIEGAPNGAMALVDI